MDKTDRGIFITFEGSEGCGKTTQFDRLARRIGTEPATARRRLVTLREPGGTPLGEEIRRLLKHTAPGWSIVPEAELLLFAASRAQLVREVVNPLLAEGALVMCDRFLDSTTVYQGVASASGPAQRRSHQRIRRRTAAAGHHLPARPAHRGGARPLAKPFPVGQPAARPHGARIARLLRGGSRRVPATWPRRTPGVSWSSMPRAVPRKSRQISGGILPSVFMAFAPRLAFDYLQPRPRGRTARARVPGDGQQRVDLRSRRAPGGDGRACPGRRGGAGELGRSRRRTGIQVAAHRHRADARTGKRLAAAGVDCRGAQGGHRARGRPSAAPGGQRFSQDAGGTAGGFAAFAAQCAAGEHDGHHPLALHQGDASRRTRRRRPAHRGGKYPAGSARAVRPGSRGGQRRHLAGRLPDDARFFRPARRRQSAHPGRAGSRRSNARKPIMRRRPTAPGLPSERIITNRSRKHGMPGSGSG